MLCFVYKVWARHHYVCTYTYTICLSIDVILYGIGYPRADESSWSWACEVWRCQSKCTVLSIHCLL